MQDPFLSSSTPGESDAADVLPHAGSSSHSIGIADPIVASLVTNPEPGAWYANVLESDREESSEAEEDTGAPECTICLLTEMDTGEELVVPCACVSMPVHGSCLESWRMRCRNPASALRCPNCREVYHTGLTPRTAEGANAAVAWVAGAAGDGRVGVSIRRSVFRTGRSQLSWLPPAEADPDIRKNVTFCHITSAFWLSSWTACDVVGDYVMVVSSTDEPPTVFSWILFDAWWAISVLCFLTSFIGLLGIRWHKWSGFKLYLYGLTFQIVLSSVVLIVQPVIWGILSGVVNRKYVFILSYAAACAAVVQAGFAIWFARNLEQCLDPNHRHPRLQTAQRTSVREDTSD